jgi:hypothetical protein
MCPNCQATTRPDADFCTTCGAPLRQHEGPAPGGQETIVGEPRSGQPPFGQPPFGQPPRYDQADPGSPGGQFAFDVKRLRTPELVIGGASLIVLLSLFLPWFGTRGLGLTASGLAGHGYLALALLAAVAVLTYLVLRAGWDTLPFQFPVAHTPSLLIGTGVQLLIVLLGFLLKPVGYPSWSFGAYLGLLAAVVACGTIVVPAIRSVQGQR